MLTVAIPNTAAALSIKVAFEGMASINDEDQRRGKAEIGQGGYQLAPFALSHPLISEDQYCLWITDDSAPFRELKRERS
jgi:hypothetical protein